jgi:hypothetical protein
LVSSIRDVVPPADPVARFVLCVSMARNDIEHSLRNAAKANEADRPEFGWWVRVAHGFTFEAITAVRAWRSESEDARAFLNALSPDAQKQLAKAVSVEQDIGGRAFEHIRQRTFHYPHPDRAYDPDADQELEELLQRLGDREANLDVDWSVKPTQIRVAFADEVALYLALNKHDPNDLKAQLERALEAATSFVNFGKALLDAYFRGRNITPGIPKFRNQ